MDNNYLNHLMALTHMSQTGPGSGQGGVMDADASLPNPQDEEDSWQNPFEMGQQLNQLEGTLSDGIEHLLPNPVTRHKLAYMRTAEQTAKWLGLKQQCQHWPLPPDIRQKLDEKLDKQLTSLNTLRQKIRADAHQQMGWLGWLVAPWPAALLWQLADTADEKAALYASLTHD